MATVFVHCGLTNTYLVESAASPLLNYWRLLPVGDSQVITLRDATVVRQTWDGSAWIYKTNALVVAATNRVLWLDVFIGQTSSTNWSPLAAVFATYTPPGGASETDVGTHLATRYGVIALFMLLGAVFVLCYQAGRKGGR